MKLALKLLLTLAAFWLAFRNVEWNELTESFSIQDPLLLLTALTAIILQNITGGLRWHHIRLAIGTSAQEDPTRTTFLYMASNMFNFFTPSTIGGDVARVWMTRHTGGPAEGLYGVVIDRIMSLVGLALLVATTLPWLLPYFGMSMKWGIAAAILSWWVALMCYVLMNMILSAATSLARIRFIGSVIAALSKISGKHAQIAASLSWTIIAHLCFVTAGYALAKSLGLNIGWEICAIFLPLVLFASALPISIGGWGVREMSMVGVMAFADVGSAKALVMSLELGLLTALVALIAGGIYLLFKSKPART